jgi:uncharacterized protein
MTALALRRVEAFQAELPDMPIEPSWILEGNPRARGTVLVQSNDKLLSSGLWECTAGRFNWTFGWDEFIHVLEGEVRITEDGGDSYSLRQGDFVHFPLGLKTEWHVPQYVRKAFTLRTPEPFEM